MSEVLHTETDVDLIKINYDYVSQQTFFLFKLNLFSKDIG